MVSRCSFGSYTEKFHLPGHLAGDLERLGHIAYTDARPFEYFSMLMRQS